MAGDGVPVLLTVEEAGELLRIGRTKAYAMAREWRDSDGRSGLPVIDLGHVLRVPRHALEELIGAELTDAIRESRVEESHIARWPTDPPSAQTNEADAEPTRSSPTSRRRRRPRNRIANQLDLFDSRPKSG